MIVVNSKRPHKFQYVLFRYSIIFLSKIENEVHNTNNIFICKCNNEVRLDQFLNHSIIGNSTLHVTPFKNKRFMLDEMKCYKICHRFVSNNAFPLLVYRDQDIYFSKNIIA